MRILYLGNNLVGLRVLGWLRAHGEEIIALVVHPSGRGKFVDDIVSASGLTAECIIDGSTLSERETLAQIEALKPDIGVSVLFGYILKRTFLDLLPLGAINLHPAYLPFNRGAYPNVWSIVDRTPAGVTLHHIDDGIDTGDIIAQRRVEVDMTDTGETLYRKLEHASIELFIETWPSIRAGTSARQPQHGSGTFHRARDVEAIDRIELDGTYTARQLIDLIRARTFPPHKGAYVEHDGRRVYLRLELAEDDT